MDERERAERGRVVAIARTWLGTPYHDHAKIKGAGVDCGQIIGATFEEAGIIDSFETGYYSPQWYMHKDGEEFVRILLSYGTHEIEATDALPGDIVVYKFARSFAHGAIIVDPGFPRIIHAYKPAWGVIENDGAIGPLGARERRFFSRW